MTTAELEDSVAHWERTVASRKRALTSAETLLARRRKQLAAAQPNLRERAFAEAVKLLGTQEQGGNNTGPIVDKIIKESGGRVGDSWCGWFVAYCYARGGSSIRSWQLGAVRLMDKAGLLRVREPQQGHVVRFNFSGAGDNHTGLFDKWVDRKAGTFATIEGNTGNTGAQSDGNGRDGVFRRVRNVNQVHDFLRFPR